MPLEGLHIHRDRAESFGSMADQYDRYRPAYPDALIADLVALQPGSVLDVGCGTGKVAVALARHGLPVLGVEPDVRMAAVTRRHGIRVDIATFESWDDGGRQFDLITCGHAWHWIDPVTGMSKAARLLRPGGTIARFWNYHVVNQPLRASFDAIYRDHAPEIERFGHDPSGTDDPDPFADHPAFTALQTRTYRWERTLNADEWVGMIATFADHHSLGAERLTALQQALHAAIEHHGGTVRAQVGTYVRLAQRA